MRAIEEKQAAKLAKHKEHQKAFDKLRKQREYAEIVRSKAKEVLEKQVIVHIHLYTHTHTHTPTHTHTHTHTHIYMYMYMLASAYTCTHFLFFWWQVERCPAAKS
jgi:hypothetical protein